MNRNSRPAALAMSTAVLPSAKVRPLVFSFMLLLAGCGGGGSDTASVPVVPPPVGPPSVEHDLSPQVIDPAVNTSTEVHVAINPSPSVNAANKLFVFLPGTGAVPDQYKLILQAGAGRGFHTLGLNYPNPTAVGILCDGSPDVSLALDCFWNVRLEIITGADSSTLVVVNNANSIVTRLTEALAYLKTTYPTEGWGQYLLANGTVDWSKVIMAGHSQGGGHAGVMAKLYALDRAVYFDSPADWSLTTNQPAAWTLRANVTPATQQFGFTNVDDMLVPYAQLTPIWLNLGLSGPAMSVDSNVAPFSSSHILTTQHAPSGLVTPTSVHSVTVADQVTPIAVNGVPLFDSVWAYLCFQ